MTDSRGQKVHMGKQKKKKKPAAPPRRAAPAVRRDYGLQQDASSSRPRGELTPADELRQALAGLKEWKEAATPVAERFAAAVAAAVNVSAAAGTDGSATGRARSRARNTPRERARAGGQSDAKTASAAAETCRRLQRAATNATTEAAPSLRLAEDLVKQLTATQRRSPNGAGGPPADAQDTVSPITTPNRLKKGGGSGSRSRSSARLSPTSPATSRSSSVLKAAASKAKGRAKSTLRTQSGDSNSRMRRSASAQRPTKAAAAAAANGSPPRPATSRDRLPSPTTTAADATFDGSVDARIEPERKEAWYDRLSSPPRGPNPNQIDTVGETGLSAQTVVAGNQHAQQWQRGPRPEVPPRSPAVGRSRFDLGQSNSDSGSGSDSDLETVGLAATRLRQRRQQNAAANGNGSNRQPHSASPQPQPQQPVAAAAAQYVPASVQLMGGGSGSGSSYTWHAAAAEFGAAESSLGVGSGLPAGSHTAGVAAVAADPPHADGPLQNADAVRGAVAIVHRGVCTFLDKARRVQEAGGIGCIFVNSAETLFVPHGTDEDRGGDIAIPAVCLRKREGESLLAIAGMGHKGVATVTMVF